MSLVCNIFKNTTYKTIRISSTLKDYFIFMLDPLMILLEGQYVLKAVVKWDLHYLPLPPTQEWLLNDKTILYYKYYFL